MQKKGESIILLISELFHFAHSEIFWFKILNLNRVNDHYSNIKVTGCLSVCVYIFYLVLELT